jgi:hypothetical protein
MKITHSDWLEKTKTHSLRSADLRRIDDALRAYEAAPSHPSLVTLRKAMHDYKRRNVKWFSDARNRLKAFSTLSFYISSLSEPVASKQAFIWCPKIDDEMRKCGDNFISNLHLSQTFFEGGKEIPDNFSPNAKLYILAHGHERMPFFTCANSKWTAKEITEMLVKDGLSTEIRDIELLVCHAGNSVNSIEEADKLLALAASMKTASESEKVKLRTEYARINALNTAVPKPRHFEDTDPENHVDLEKMLLPLAAQLSGALKEYGFSNFRMKSYKAPVSQDSNEKTHLGDNSISPAGVRIDLESQIHNNPKVKQYQRDRGGAASKYARASDFPEYSVIWQ